MSDREISIGGLFELLDAIREQTLAASKGTTEVYEKRISDAVFDLAGVVADVVYLMREHLSCHDCRVVDHTHDTGEFAAGVEQVYDGVVDRVDA